MPTLRVSEDCCINNAVIDGMTTKMAPKIATCSYEKLFIFRNNELEIKITSICIATKTLVEVDIKGLYLFFKSTGLLGYFLQHHLDANKLGHTKL